MEQLLQITTIPISIEIQVNKASLQYNNQLPKVNITRERGGFQMKAEPIKLQLDNQKMYDSIGLKCSDTLTREYRDEGIKIAYQATAKIVEDGNKLLDAQHYTPARLAAQKNQRSIETIMEFLPKDGPEVSWSGGTLNIQYQADQLDFDWNAHPKASFEFVPGNIEFNVATYPKVNIEYVGGPIYVPASADPNYQAPEIDVTI